ncbi:hypothetical protein Hanom_Chr07g00663051 [Helianthus anomalus]
MEFSSHLRSIQKTVVIFKVGYFLCLVTSCSLGFKMRDALQCVLTQKPMCNVHAIRIRGICYLKKI